MPPPFYSDLGKASRDIFNKGYNFGLLKLDVRTKTDTGVEFKFGGVQNLETKNVVGSLETNYKFKEHGVTFTEKWNTDNELSTEISIDAIVKGAKVGCETSFTPRVGVTTRGDKSQETAGQAQEKSPQEADQTWIYTDKRVKFKGEYKNDICALNVESDFKNAPPVLKASAVAGYEGWVVGGSAGYDASKLSISDYQFSMGYIMENLVVNTTIQRGMVFSGSIFQHFNDTVESSVNVSWAMDSKSITVFGIGCRWFLDQDAVIRFKLDSKYQLGLGYSQKLRDGVNLSLSAQISSRSMSTGNTSLGFSLELDA